MVHPFRAHRIALVTVSIVSAGCIDDPSTQAVESAIDGATYATIQDATTPSVAVDSNSEAVYVAYFRDDHDGSDGTLYVQRSDDGGATFGEPVRVNDKDGEALLAAQWSAPEMAVGPNGELYIVWYHADFSDPENFPWGEVTLRFARSTDGGATFSDAVNPAPADPRGEQSYPSILAAADNQVHIAYLNLDASLERDASGSPSVVRVVSSENGGLDWGDSVIADSGACQCCDTSMAWGPDNEFYVSSRSVFLDTAEEVTDEGRSEYHNAHHGQQVIRDITVYRTTDGGQGKVFTEPSRVGRDDWHMNGCPDAGPGMAFDGEGRLHIAWFTGSDEASNGPGFYYAQSDDKGDSFHSQVSIIALEDQWVPPTTQYLVTDARDNAWIVFVNSQGLRKAADYAETFAYEGQGTIHLAVVDSDGNVLRNGPFASGAITKHYPHTVSSDGRIAISWMEGDAVRVAVIDTV